MLTGVKLPIDYQSAQMSADDLNRKFPATIQWTFPNTVSNDQNVGLFKYRAVAPISFIGFDMILNTAPSGQAIIVDWKVDDVIIPAYRMTLAVGETYVLLSVAVSLDAGQTLQPFIYQVGTNQPGQTMALRARGI